MTDVMQITDNDVGGGKEDVCTIDDTTDDKLQMIKTRHYRNS